MILQTAGSFRGYIQTLCAAPRFRGSGVGTQLLHYAEDRVSAYSPNLFICVSEFNKGALKLYLNFGFKQVGVIPDFVKEGYTELLLRKTRGPLVKG
jgi:ribosomal protein S18 acetylase RimI-like enzyme